MAEAAQDPLTCPICLDLLKDPVTIPCGHSYCMRCIKGCWDQDDQTGVYSCPLCRGTFSPRPALNKNTMLAELAETLRKRGLQAAPPAVCYAGPGDVECDICTGRKQKALKSCLVCLASFCENHLQPHYESPALKKHKLVEASTQLQEKICSQHDEPLKIYCRKDQKIICSLCLLDDHRGHDTVSVSAERKEKQKQLEESQRKSQQRIQEREKELQELRKAMESLRSSAQAAVEDSERIFTEMIRSMERRRSEVTELIRAKEKAELGRVEGLLERLEQETAELRRRDAELEQLSHTEDHIHFLQSFQSLSHPSGSEELPRMALGLYASFVEVRKSVSDMKEHVEDFCKQDMDKISGEATKVQILLPQTREEFLHYSCQLTLDPNTAHRRLHLSEGNSRVTLGHTQPNPDHPERFDEWKQVLCRESVSGRCYWEVEWSGVVVSISVSYKGIRRRGQGDESGFGSNDLSWSLFCYPHSLFFRHNNNETEVPVAPSGSRVGVYLDHRAGTLSFYSVSDTMTLLHRVQTTFTQPLHPGFEFGFGLGSTVKILRQTSSTKLSW